MSAISQHASLRAVGAAATTTAAPLRSRRVVHAVATRTHRRQSTAAGAASRSSFLGAGAGRVVDSVVVGGAKSSRRRRGPVRPAAVGPNEVNELAGAALLTLSGAEAVLGKVSFGSLLTATSIYEYKVREGMNNREKERERETLVGVLPALARDFRSTHQRPPTNDSGRA